MGSDQLRSGVLLLFTLPIKSMPVVITLGENFDYLDL